ncbi:MAG: gliding motility-associated C-terminal domain-containing protein [Brumimicrobium sp.]|nr:gliding motility-associated C-terminal domain-containing protein [Brumimicrobium sp.]
MNYVNHYCCKSLLLAAMLFLSNSTTLNAQLEGAHWYFGSYAGLDFTSGSPVPAYDGKLITGEGCSSVSDRQGNLLFYTDGMTVYDRNHNVMPNGMGLLGHSSSAMSSVVCPKPGTWIASAGSYGAYIICTIDYEGGPNGVRWSEVDMSLNGGFGDIVVATKNTHLIDTRTVEAANFAVHDNGCDYWLITKEQNNAVWKVFPVTSAGVGATPVVSTVGSITPPTYGYIKASPNSELISMVNHYTGLQVFNFNRTTGQLTSKYSDQTLGVGHYSLEYSPNGRFIYFVRLSDPNIYQLDLNATNQTDFINSRVIIGATANTNHNYRLGALQLAPNGKIYLALISTTYLGVIDQPNLNGIAANYIDYAVNIGGVNIHNGLNTSVILGLPSFPNFFLKEPKEIMFSQLCNSFDAHFNLSNYDDLYGQSWFVTTSGNPFSSTPNSLNDNFFETLSPGSYDVKVLLDYNCFTDSVQGTFVIQNYDTVNLGIDRCYEDNIVLNAGNIFDSYEWQDGSTNQTFQVNQPGVYSCTVGKLGDNLIFNGDFELGNTGFTTQYYNPPGDACTGQGTYLVNTYSSNGWFAGCGDHTSGSGNMMIIDADCLTGQTGSVGYKFWCQTVPILPNTDYYFSAFIADAGIGGVPPNVTLEINGVNLTTLNVTSPGCVYEELTYIWNSGTNSTADICLREYTGACGGHDFIVDDISFHTICYSTDQVEIFALPVADFNFVNACDNSPITMNTTATTSANGFTNYGWDFNADGVIEQMGNTVSHIFPNDGFYVVNHMVEDANGCKDTVSHQVTVYALPLTDFSATQVCEDESTEFTDLSTITPVDGDYITNYAWSFGNNTQSNLQNPIISYGVEGIYNTQLIVTTNYGCKDTMIKSVEVYPLPEVDFSFSDGCLNLETVFTNNMSISNANTINSIAQWNWDFGDGSFSTEENPTYLYNQDGVFNVVLTIISNRGCENSINKSVTIYPLPHADFIGLNLEGCSPFCSEISSISTVSGNSQVTNYYWEISDGSYYQNASPSIGDCFENNSGQDQYFDVTLIVTTDHGCKDTMIKNQYVSVYHNPIVDFYFLPEEPTVLDPVVSFLNTSIYSNDFTWFYDSSTTNDISFTHEFPPLPETYIITLIAKTNNDCVDTIRKLITIKDELILYIPNTFTPDGNVYNEVFHPIFTSGFEASDYNLLIFNRWGELVFETNDVHEGWDGRIRGLGKEAPEGTYVWKVEFMETMSDKRNIFTGHVNLIR